LPWLVGGLVGSTLAGLVVLDFSNAMSAAPVLGMFIPIVSSTAGNIGIQSSAIVVQGLASGSLWMSDMLKHIFKELRIGLLNGLVIALVLTCFIVLIAKIAPIIHIQQIDRLLQLCGTSALAMVVVIMMAAFVGTAVPLVLHRFGIDPAIATGPFITTSCDIFGLLIYFMIAQWIYFR
jgi:magnesium transporter